VVGELDAFAADGAGIEHHHGRAGMGLGVVEVGGGDVGAGEAGVPFAVDGEDGVGSFAAQPRGDFATGIGVGARLCVVR
jgi:hypothetical protein